MTHNLCDVTGGSGLRVKANELALFIVMVGISLACCLRDKLLILLGMYVYVGDDMETRAPFAIMVIMAITYDSDCLRSKFLNRDYRPFTNSPTRPRFFLAR